MLSFVVFNLFEYFLLGHSVRLLSDYHLPTAATIYPLTLHRDFLFPLSAFPINTFDYFTTVKEKCIVYNMVLDRVLK